jgi:hypothetical protein
MTFLIYFSIPELLSSAFFDGLVLFSRAVLTGCFNETCIYHLSLAENKPSLQQVIAKFAKQFLGCILVAKHILKTSKILALGTLSPSDNPRNFLKLVQSVIWYSKSSSLRL